MLLGAGLVLVGGAVLYFAVTMKSPIAAATSVASGKPAGTSLAPAASIGQQR